MSFELLLSLFVQYGYWIVFFGILLDNAGLPLPGELFLDFVFGNGTSMKVAPTMPPTPCAK